MVGPDIHKNYAWGWINRTSNQWQYIAFDDISLIDITDDLITINGVADKINCENNLATYTLTANGSTSYTWQPGNIVSPSITVSPTSSTTYTVYAETIPECVQTATYNIEVLPIPQALASSSNPTICPGEWAILSANGSNFNPALNNWSPPPFPIGGTGAGVLVIPNATTTYTVKLTSVDGCTNTAQTSVTVLNPNNSISITGNNTLCNGQTTTLAATGANNYTWTPCITGCNGNSLTVSPNTTTTYTVSGINQCGVLSSQTINVTVNNTPTISVNSSTLCSGNSATLIANGATNYTWMPGNLNGTTVITNPTVTTIYTITGNNPSCPNTSITNTVLVYPNPIVSVNNATVCINGTASLTASGALTYT